MAAGFKGLKEVASIPAVKKIMEVTEVPGVVSKTEVKATKIQEGNVVPIPMKRTIFQYHGVPDTVSVLDVPDIPDTVSVPDTVTVPVKDTIEEIPVVADKERHSSGGVAYSNRNGSMTPKCVCASPRHVPSNDGSGGSGGSSRPRPSTGNTTTPVVAALTDEALPELPEK